METRRVLVLSLLALASVAIVADSRCFPGLAQEKYTGKLSSEQWRKLELSISTNAAPSGFSTGQVHERLRFKAGECIDVGIVMTNKGVEPVKVCAFSDPYNQNRPELLLVGKPLAYTEHISELVRQSDKEPCGVLRVPDVVELKPNVPIRVPSVQLQEWYGPLKPGQYKLTLKRTFACCADGVLKPSNEITFEVTP